MSVGKIEGVIDADGTVKLRSKFTIEKLPPEVTEIAGAKGGATMASLRAALPSRPARSSGTQDRC